MAMAAVAYLHSLPAHSHIVPCLTRVCYCRLLFALKVCMRCGTGSPASPHPNTPAHLSHLYRPPRCDRQYCKLGVGHLHCCRLGAVYMFMDMGLVGYPVQPRSHLKTHALPIKCGAALIGSLGLLHRTPHPTGLMRAAITTVAGGAGLGVVRLSLGCCLPLQPGLGIGY
jgi:hypothetical protein